jgi:hypothetical protein
VIGWSDLRTPGNGSDIYTQHLSMAAGAAQWTANGVQVSDALNEQNTVAISADASGGAALVWQDYRNGGYADLYGQRVDASGQVADPCTPPDTLATNIPITTSLPQNYRTIEQGWFFWSAVGVRGASGSDWDIETFDQGSWGLNPYPTCFGFPLSGSYGSSTVDFVVGDFTDLQTPPGKYGVRAYRYSGAGNATMEWDDGPDLLTKDDGIGYSSNGAWTGLLDCFDVALTAGTTYYFQLTHPPSADIRVLLFTSYGSPDYYYVVPRSARVAESPGPWMTYQAPATDHYGVVVVNENGVAGGYNLKVWSTAQVGVPGGPAVSTGLRQVVPNPSAGQVQIQFAMREAGEAAFDVVDMAGRLVARVPGKRWEAGAWSVPWDGRTTRGTPAPPGIYFVQMRVDGQRVGLGRLALIR